MLPLSLRAFITKEITEIEVKYDFIAVSNIKWKNVTKYAVKYKDWKQNYSKKPPLRQIFSRNGAFI